MTAYRITGCNTDQAFGSWWYAMDDNEPNQNRIVVSLWLRLDSIPALMERLSDSATEYLPVCHSRIGCCGHVYLLHGNNSRIRLQRFNLNLLPEFPAAPSTTQHHPAPRRTTRHWCRSTPPSVAKASKSFSTWPSKSSKPGRSEERWGAPNVR